MHIYGNPTFSLHINCLGLTHPLLTPNVRLQKCLGFVIFRNIYLGATFLEYQNTCTKLNEPSCFWQFFYWSMPRQMRRNVRQNHDLWPWRKFYLKIIKKFNDTQFERRPSETYSHIQILTTFWLFVTKNCIFLFLRFSAENST